jgi:hypothetical protein
MSSGIRRLWATAHAFMLQGIQLGSEATYRLL